MVVLLMRVDGAKVLGLLEQRQAQNAVHVSIKRLQQGQLESRPSLGTHGHVRLEGFRSAKHIAEGHRAGLRWHNNKWLEEEEEEEEETANKMKRSRTTLPSWLPI